MSFRRRPHFWCRCDDFFYELYSECNLENFLMIFFILSFQEYSQEIDKLKSELQAARDKDGVFLPKEIYEQQIKTKESCDTEIKEKTLQIKALEEEMEKLNVSYFASL